METVGVPSSRCRTQIDRAWFKVSWKKVTDTMMTSWITSTNNTKKRSKTRETVIKELMLIRWTSNRCRRCWMALIRRKTLLMSINMKTKAQIWTLIRKIWRRRVCWIKITMLKNFRCQMPRNKCRSIMEVVDQKWDKKVIMKWPATSIQKQCFKVICSHLTTTWRTEIATPLWRDTPTSSVFVPQQENPCTVESAPRC